MDEVEMWMKWKGELGLLSDNKIPFLLHMVTKYKYKFVHFILNTINFWSPW